MSFRSAKLSILAIIGINNEKYNLIKSKNALTINFTIK